MSYRLTVRLEEFANSQVQNVEVTGFKYERLRTSLNQLEPRLNHTILNHLRRVEYAPGYPDFKRKGR